MLAEGSAAIVATSSLCSEPTYFTAERSARVMNMKQQRAFEARWSDQRWITSAINGLSEGILPDNFTILKSASKWSIATASAVLGNIVGDRVKTELAMSST
jgi:hypothetical protein